MARRREAAGTLPALACGCRDPLPCDLAGRCPAPPRDEFRGLAEALDHLDSVGLCCCWTAPRRHAGAAA